MYEKDVGKVFTLLGERRNVISIRFPMFFSLRFLSASHFKPRICLFSRFYDAAHCLDTRGSCLGKSPRHMHEHGVWSETENVLLRAYGCGNYEKLCCRVDTGTGDAKVHRRHSRRVQARRPNWDLWMLNKVESAIPTCPSRLSSHIYRLLVCIMQSPLHQVHHLVIFKIFRFHLALDAACSIF